jgi:uncharacterized protein YecE (DUF72 family)
MSMTTLAVVGTAGWSVPRGVAGCFPDAGSHLSRYAQVMRGVEINSSFYRPHRRTTWERWAATTPGEFRFAVKMPKTITHEARLAGTEALLDVFLEEVGGLGAKLAVLLVQLPPSAAFHEGVADAFFEALCIRHGGPVVCEPRHATWFSDEADALLATWHVGRVAADPSPHPRAATPGGWLGPAGDGRGALVYYRWHGSPRMYWSAYDEAWLETRASDVACWPAGTTRWCVFDNTAAGHALANALAFDSLCAR